MVGLRVVIAVPWPAHFDGLVYVHNGKQGVVNHRHFVGVT